jgi:YggT family protein
MNTVIQIIRVLFQAYTIIVFVDVLLTYFLPPYNPIRTALDRLVEPLLNPIRRVIPAIGGLDFSPIVLIIILQLFEYLLLQILVSIG